MRIRQINTTRKASDHDVPMEIKWIVVDLDGTVCDIAHRVHLAQAKQWEDFHALIPDDKMIKSVIDVVESLSYNFKILLCTGRNERHRAATVKWLTDNKCDSWFDDLIMRPDEGEDSILPDHELKLKLLDDFFDGREPSLKRVTAILEDRDKVVESFRNAGYNCWQVANGQY